jgi:hypothetical protein
MFLMQNIGDRIQNISTGFRSPNAWEIVGVGFSIVSQRANGSLIDKWHITNNHQKTPFIADRFTCDEWEFVHVFKFR